jgi:hypothetical protein
MSSIAEFGLCEDVELHEKTNVPIGESVKITLTLKDKDSKEIGLYEDTAKIEASKKDPTALNEINYKFIIQDIATKLNIDAKEIDTIVGGIDINNDGLISKYEETTLRAVSKREGTLRMGLFFDGTGNDATDEKKHSNIRKLFLVYPNNYDPDIGGQKDTKNPHFPKIQSAYIRGVGSKDASSEEDNVLGGAAGLGAKDRLEGMLFYIQRMIEIYQEKKECYPEFLELDIFGFSRGAAMARYFVNLLKQDKGSFYKIKYKYDAKNLKIRTLNLFDTVGSMGVAGKDYDPGFTYHIDESHISDAITHFVANDEYRYNFDGQFIASNNRDYPTDKISKKTHEYILLGAHSDIGGGYSKEEHQVKNNDLPKVSLNKMYERCVSVEVPFLEIPSGEDFKAWEVPIELKIDIDYFEGLYKDPKYPDLKKAHKKLREWQANNNDKFILGDREINKKRQTYINLQMQRFMRKPKNEEIYSKIELELVQIFGNSWSLYNEFVNKSNAFHDKYVHISHGTGFGMGSEEEGNKLHRIYFIPQRENMRALANQTNEMLRIASYIPGLAKESAKGVVKMLRANKAFDKLTAKEFKDY